MCARSGVGGGLSMRSGPIDVGRAGDVHEVGPDTATGRATRGFAIPWDVHFRSRVWR